MRKHITLVGIFCLALLGFLTGCDPKPAPLKEGIIWKVVWSETANSQTGLCRVKMLPPNSPFAGEYGVEMSGKLYPTFLELQRVGNSHSQIIPFSQILQLEFGE